MNKFWLVKTEPDEFSWQDLQSSKTSVWDGVRNYQARNNLRNMAFGDFVFIYHSYTDKSIVGIATVSSEVAFQDPKTTDPKWVSVLLSPYKSLVNPVSLEQIKTNTKFAGIPLIAQSRLSVMPVSTEHANLILKLGNTSI